MCIKNPFKLDLMGTGRQFISENIALFCWAFTLHLEFRWHGKIYVTTCELRVTSYELKV